MKQRLLIRDGNDVRRLASVTVSDRDGSIVLSIVRKGEGSSGWEWVPEENAYRAVEYERPSPKSFRITLHPSGQVNFHKGAGHSVFLPALFDLAAPILLLDYLIPSISALDVYSGAVNEDQVCEFPIDRIARVCFRFEAIPEGMPERPGEYCRLGVRGAFGLSCSVLIPEGEHPLLQGPAPGVFTTIVLAQALPNRALREDEAYTRFHQLSQKALAHAEDAPEQIGATGPIIFGPRDGIWTIVCSRPMHAHPKLQVDFIEQRYRADVIAISANDRLQLARVQFKVFDLERSAYVKNPVGIVGYTLSAEL